jgi:spore coat polysaccharide biosynthesis predicted glycosyltransferase SpsG
MINDIGPVPSNCDWVLNSSPDARRTIAGNKGPHFLLGTQYHPLRAEVARLSPIVIHKHVKNILVTLGGISWGNRLNTIVNKCSERLPDARFHVILGPHSKAFKAERVLFYRSPKNMGAIMRKCDMAISGGGQTLFELAHLGVPTVAVPLADNQKSILRGFQRSGAIVIASNIADQTRALANHAGQRKKMSFAGKNMVDGKGAQRFVATVTRGIN